MDPPKEEDHGGGGSDSAAHQHQESSVLFDYFGDLYSRDYLESWLQTSGPRNEVAGGPNHEVVLTVDDVKPLWGSTSEEQATEDPRFGQQNPVHRINASPDVYQDWHQRGFLSHQESFLHHHATCRHLDFDALMPCHSSTPRSHGSYADHNHAGYGSNHAGYSSGVLPPSLMNLGHSLLGNGEPQESSGWQQFNDARKMPFQYQSNQETFIQMPQDMNFSSTFSDPFTEVSDLVGDGQHADEVTDIPKSWSRAKASKLQDHESVVDSNLVTPRRRGQVHT